MKEESVKPKTKETDKGTKRSIKVRTVSSKQIGLKIYTAKSKGWPRVITKGRILEGIEDGTYKWSYQHTELNEHEVMGKLIFNQIDLEDCFHILEDNLFHGTESGNATAEDCTSP